MSAQLMMLIVTVVIGFLLIFMVGTKKGSAANAFYLWIIQFVVIYGISLFRLNISLIDTFTSTFGLITLLMLILVLMNRKSA